MAPRTSCCGGALLLLLLAVAACAPACQARRMRRPLAAKQFGAGGQPVSVSLSELKPSVSAVWAPSIRASARRLQVPVSGLPGTPLPTSQMSRLQYTVTYTRRPTYLLRGAITISPTAFSSDDGADGGGEAVFELPTISLSQGGSSQAVPRERVSCPSFRVAAGTSITCTFSAPIFADSGPPPSGRAQAALQLADGSAAVSTPEAEYDFAATLTSPSGARFSSSDAPAEFLAAAMQGAGGSATVTNYFEPGAGVLIPAGIEGAQPAENLVLSDTKTFTYTALFADVERAKCGQTLKVLCSAAVEASSDGLTPPQTVYSTVDVDLIGCDSAPGQQFQGNAPCNQQPSTPFSTPAPSFSTPAPAYYTPPPAAAPTGDIRAPPGVSIAAFGSTLCGPSNAVCSPDERCLDNLVCCAQSSFQCGGTCCPSTNTCINGLCLAPGSSVCGTSACGPDSVCRSGKCCARSAPSCGNSCCDANAGEVCIAGACHARGSTACGGTACAPDQTCAAPGVCCAAGATSCGGQCCSGQCLNGQCVAPGSTTCAGGLICAPGTFCAGGAVCCPVGAEVCSGQCCGAGHACQQGRCIPVGSNVCGSQVCSPGQSCVGGICCDAGHSGCAGGCCNTAAGMQCINNQCLPAGTQPCGATSCPPGLHCAEPARGLCCSQGQGFNYATQACAPLGSEGTASYGTSFYGSGRHHGGYARSPYYGGGGGFSYGRLRF